jgi:hypothetical protein
MKTRARLYVGLAVVVAFFAYLAWSTMAAQAAECRVTVNFRGRVNSAVASAANEREAAKSAQTTACGTIASGMDASIACDNTPPVARECHRP